MRRRSWAIIVGGILAAAGLIAYAVVIVSISDQSGQMMEVRPTAGGPYLPLHADDVDQHIPFLVEYLAQADAEGRAVVTDAHAARIEEFLRVQHGSDADWR